MIQVVSLGSLTLDLFFQDRSLTISKKRFFLAIGGKYVVEKFSQAVGGGGGNVAVGLSRAGIKSAVWSEIGTGGVSQLIIGKLVEEGVTVDLLEKKPEFTNVSAILLSPQGERTIINHRSHECELTFGPAVKTALQTSRALYLGNMPELPLALRVGILKYAKQHRLTTFLNLGVKDCRLRLSKLRDLFENVDYLIVNRYELADILMIPPNELVPKLINYQSQVFHNPAAFLVITDGQFGAFSQSSSSIDHQEAIPVQKVVDATGAGDAFTSGFVSGVLYQQTLPACLLAGVRNAASVIQIVNAQDGLLGRKELGLGQG